MHHALEIQEILLNIVYEVEIFHPGDLYALARTCRTFMEPALDALWHTLDGLAPLVQCIPEACQVHSPEKQAVCYSFRRPLTQTEWDTLHGYTRRVRSLAVPVFCAARIDIEFIRSFSKPPTGQPLFPNLQILALDYSGVEQERALLLLPLPSLVTLDIALVNAKFFQDAIMSFAQRTPNIKSFIIYGEGRDDSVRRIDFRFVCQWQNLHAVVGPEAQFRLNTLQHLSSMLTLTKLTFFSGNALTKQVARVPFDSPLSFPCMRVLELYCRSLTTGWRLLSHLRLPVIKKLSIWLEDCPSEREMTFLSDAPTSNIGHTIQELNVTLCYSGRNLWEERKAVLGFEHIQPWMAFTNLCVVSFNMKCKVNLSDDELLALASAWPHLTCIGIGDSWGWGTQSGITPNGVLQLLQKCPLLLRFQLAMDVRGYTEISPSPTLLGSTTPQLTSVNVMDTAIEVESVPALAAFFARILALSPRVSIAAWDFTGASRIDKAFRYGRRWRELRKHVRDSNSERLEVCSYGP